MRYNLVNFGNNIEIHVLYGNGTLYNASCTNIKTFQ